jgi:hypothetical protein
MTPEQIAKCPVNSSIPADVAVYLESVNKVVAGNKDVDWSSLGKADLKKFCGTKEIELTGDETKDDLIVLLENFSDAEVK